MLSMQCETTMGRVIQMTIRTYSQLIHIPTFEERFEYLRLNGQVGADTFGFDRYLNQVFYRSDRWKKVRDHVIIRDNACDLACEGHDIQSRILIHHMNPLTIEDIMNETDYLMDPEFLISTMLRTHNAIHYGDKSLLPSTPMDRRPTDTCPWRH